jgi:3,4-dihydroxy 2-butanone 4-phosphate synthase/GTP cyclohydrolase II
MATTPSDSSPRTSRSAGSKSIREIEPGPGLSTISDAIADIAAGKMVILVDDEDRENEGDLCMAADKCTPEAINFMATHGRGLICLPLEEEQLDRLHLGMMVADYENSTPYGTAFTISIEAREGVTTGISAADRSRTVLAAVNPEAKPTDILRPGHIFPLRARADGRFRRSGTLSRLPSLWRDLRDHER